MTGRFKRRTVERYTRPKALRSTAAEQRLLKPHMRDNARERQRQLVFKAFRQQRQATP
jgi:hypothetical protein